MKNYALFFIVITTSFTINCIAQDSVNNLDDAKKINPQIISNTKPSIVAYNEEKANLAYVIPVKNEKAVNINILSTYERILEKGYKTKEMLIKVADGRYFDGDFVTSAKWYCELFEIATDLQAVYYFRYAQSLKAIGDNEKATEMMKLYRNINPQK